MDDDAATCELDADRARERELRVFRGAVGARVPGCDRARHRGDVDDICGSAGLERRQERPQAPDRAEVVRPNELFDLLRLEVEEAASTRNARVVDEQADRRMPLAHGRRDPLDFDAVGDVAGLVLGSDLPGDFAQTLLAPREQNQPPAAPGERSRDRGSDPARAAGDDGDLCSYRQTLTLRRACAEPRRETTTTRSLCGPRFAARVRQVAV